MRRSAAVAVAAAAFAIASACAKTLPDQDLRILSVTPQIKLSADILWKDYQTDRAAANRRYHGQAMLITGVVTAVDKSPTARAITFGQQQTQGAGVRANLLDDTADQILKGAEVKQRITLKCFCDGLASDVILKSCVKP